MGRVNLARVEHTVRHYKRETTVFENIARRNGLKDLIALGKLTAVIMTRGFLHHLKKDHQ